LGVAGGAEEISPLRRHTSPPPLLPGASGITIEWLRPVSPFREWWYRLLEGTECDDGQLSRGIVQYLCTTAESLLLACGHIRRPSEPQALAVMLRGFRASPRSPRPGWPLHRRPRIAASAAEHCARPREDSQRGVARIFRREPAICSFDPSRSCS